MLRVVSILTVITLALAGGAFAQDLGSSNLLFGGKKKVSSAKTAPKKKPAASSVKRTNPKSTAKKSAPTKKPTTAEKKPAVPGKASAAAKKTKTPTKFPVPIARTKRDKPDTSKSQAAKPPDRERFQEFRHVVIEPRPAKKSNPPSGPSRAAIEEQFEALIEEGYVARDNRDYTGAESAYKLARTIKPKDPRSVFGLGNIYGDQHRWEDAEKSYRAALDIDPDLAIAHIALSYVLTQALSLPNLSERYEESERLARRAITLAPSNALAFDQLGVAYELRGLIGAESESAYRNAIRLDASFAPAHAHLGRLLRRRGLKREAENAYKEAYRRADNPASMVIVAESLQSEQRFGESKKLLKKAVDEDPRNAAALLLLGRALIAEGDFDEAETTLLRVLEIGSNNFMSNSLLADLYLRQRRTEQAENAVLQALRFVSPYEKRRLAGQFEAIGDSYMRGSRRDKAERAYRQAIDLDADRDSLAAKLSKARFG